MHRVKFIRDEHENRTIHLGEENQLEISERYISVRNDLA